MGLGSSYWSEVIEVLREIIPIYDKVNSIISLGKDVEHRNRGISGRVFKGNKILDGMSGLWCVSLGYGNNELIEAAYNQMKELPYYNSFFQCAHPPAIELSQKISSIAPESLNHVFFTGSGSEANDTMVRMARRYWQLQG